MRNRFILEMKSRNINCVFHYLPLHLSEFGNKVSKFSSMPITEDFSKRLVRLPLWLDDLPIDRVVDSVKRVVTTLS